MSPNASLKKYSTYRCYSPNPITEAPLSVRPSQVTSEHCGTMVAVKNLLVVVNLTHIDSNEFPFEFLHCSLLVQLTTT